VTAERYRYRAFISYSHRDASVAQWLHGALESYRAPKHLIGRETPTGVIQKRLGPLFRDRDELPVAADLTGQINEALAATQFLIVLCSVASAKSKWVNQEVINFKRLKGAGSIIAVIVDGEPFASTTPGREAEECFAPALRFHVNADGVVTDQPAEPIAADLRDGKDGKRLVKLKVLAGLLGVGLDELVQRESLRRQRFMTAVTFASLAGIGVMGALTFNAIEARNEAEVAQERAERQKGQAEGLIEFMLGDLRDKLQPVGRLDVLDAVGEKALAYFGTLKSDEVDADTLGKRARTLHLIGELKGLGGDMNGAIQAFEEARLTTDKLLSLQPTNTQRLFEHAQSVFWLGQYSFRGSRLAEAHKNLQKYEELAKALRDSDQKNEKWQLELAQAGTNLGILFFAMKKPADAIVKFTAAQNIFESAIASGLKSDQLRLDLGNTLAWRSDVYRFTGELGKARQIRLDEKKIYEDLKSLDEKNTRYDQKILVVSRVLGSIAFEQGDLKQAASHLQSAIKIGALLESMDQENETWHQLVARTRIDLAELYFYTNMHDRALNELRLALSVADRLAAKPVAADVWRIQLWARGHILETEVNLDATGAEVALMKLESISGKLRSFQKNASAQNFIADNITTSELLAYIEFNRGSIESVLGRNETALSTWSNALHELECNSALGSRSLMLCAILESNIGKTQPACEKLQRLSAKGFMHPLIKRVRSTKKVNCEKK